MNAFTGIRINAVKRASSQTKRKENKNKSKRIKKVLINIPIPIEKTTSPSLYSFFKGLKKVFKNKGREKRFKNALFKELKNNKIPIGAS